MLGLTSEPARPLPRWWAPVFRTHIGRSDPRLSGSWGWMFSCWERASLRSKSPSSRTQRSRNCGGDGKRQTVRRIHGKHQPVGHLDVARGLQEQRIGGQTNLMLRVKLPLLLAELAAARSDDRDAVASALAKRAKASLPAAVPDVGTVAGSGSVQSRPSASTTNSRAGYWVTFGSGCRASARNGCAATDRQVDDANDDVERPAGEPQERQQGSDKTPIGFAARFPSSSARSGRCRRAQRSRVASSSPRASPRSAPGQSSASRSAWATVHRRPARPPSRPQGSPIEHSRPIGPGHGHSSGVGCACGPLDRIRSAARTIHPRWRMDRSCRSRRVPTSEELSVAGGCAGWS